MVHHGIVRLSILSEWQSTIPRCDLEDGKYLPTTIVQSMYLVSSTDDAYVSADRQTCMNSYA